MAVALPKDLIELLEDQDTTKVLATLDENGFPHAVVKQSLQLGEDGNIFYLEFLESSGTNKNLVRSIWFDTKVAITVTGKGGQSFQIKGRPVKTLITGEVFNNYYRATRERLGDVDLAAVWVIEPLEAINENFAFRKAEEDLKHPLFIHLDRLAKVGPILGDLS